MALLTGRSPRVVLPAVVAATLLVCAGGLATLSAAAELASSPAAGNPSDWLARGGWLLVQALAGFALACGVVVVAWRWGAGRQAQR